jgi:Ca2+-transporting ATPase
VHGLEPVLPPPLLPPPRAAIAWELLLLGLIVYLPLLSIPFGTVALAAIDWLAVGAAGLSVAPVLELAKWMARRGWFGPLA